MERFSTSSGHMKNQTLISIILGSLLSIGCTISSSIAQSTLKGTVIYPSDFLPPQKVCAENVKTKQLFCFETKENKTDFSISVKAGTYQIFARECTVKSDIKTKLCGGSYSPKRIYYNEHAKCGLTVECEKKFRKKNSPILVRIRSGQTIANIKPHDWYSK